MKYGDLNLGQIEALVNKLGGMTAVEGILRGGDLRDSIAKLLTPTGSVCSITVDYALTLEQMIAAGRYDWKNGDITAKNFTVTGTGTVKLEVRLFHYGRGMSTKDVLKDIDQNGYRPIKIEELLALGATKPELQREFPIIALGSVWQDLRGGRDVPFLSGDGSRRHLNLRWIGRGWSEICRFGAVRK